MAMAAALAHVLCAWAQVSSKCRKCTKTQRSCS
jgi:hypothetical protein